MWPIQVLFFETFCCFFPKFFLKNLFTSGCAESWLLGGPFSSCSEQGLFSSCSTQAAHCSGFCGAWALGCEGFGSCGMWARQLRLLGPRARARQLWHMDTVDPRHVGSSRMQGLNPHPWYCRWILYTEPPGNPLPKYF